MRLFSNYLSPQLLNNSSINGYFLFLLQTSLNTNSLLLTTLIHLIAIVYTKKKKHAIERTLIMPSVVDKASQISFHRKRSVFKKSYLSGKEYLAKICYQFNFPSITPTHRLVYQRSDMPRSGQDKQAIVTRNKRSSESPEPTEHRHSRPVLVPSRSVMWKQTLT